MANIDRSAKGSVPFMTEAQANESSFSFTAETRRRRVYAERSPDVSFLRALLPRRATGDRDLGAADFVGKVRFGRGGSRDAEIRVSFLCVSSASPRLCGERLLSV